ncbi:MAG: hypothetical protein R6X05_18485 [Desulfobacterales bacterium]
MNQAVKERDFIESIFTNMMSGLVIVDRNGILSAMNHYTAAGNSAGHAALQDEKVQNRRVTDSRGGYEGVGPAVCRPLD